MVNKSTAYDWLKVIFITNITVERDICLLDYCLKNSRISVYKIIAMWYNKLYKYNKCD